MKLEFRLLGDIAVLADGHPLELGGARQRSVLALLILQRNHSVTTELLADRLWPDDQPLTATKTIQVYVSRIRHALGPDAGRLASSSAGYRLAVGDEELDAARFERGLRLARETVASAPPASSASAFEDALAQWSGPALADLAGEQFARREADRLEELRIQAFEELFELRIGAGKVREAIGELRRLLGDQPGRERLWRLLMLALYSDGRPGEALQAYQDARRYLAEELGLDPSPELQELEREILTQEAPRSRQTEVLVDFSSNEAKRADASADASLEYEAAGRRTRRVVTVLRAEAVRASHDDDLDPELLDMLERRALDVVRTAVERHGGTIDRADHDGVTAVFGLAIAREDDALRAVRAASELRGDALSTDPVDEVTFRVGVASGEVLASPSDGRGSMITGIPPQVATQLVARAAPHEVLLAPETERLLRAVTTTEDVSFEATNETIASSAVRLVALRDGELIPRRPTTRFIGRTVERGALLAAFERVETEGKPGLVTVVGAPGVGKSRLVAEGFGGMSKRARVLRSRCLPYGDGITYWPIRELVLAASEIGPGETRDDAIAKLQTVVAGSDRGALVSRHVASIIGLSDEPVPGEEIAWAVRRFFEALAAERPLVLLVDDLQWAELALIDLLEHILDLGLGPMLVVTVARPELEELRPDRLVRPSLLTVRLESLEESDAAELLDHLAPELPHGLLRSQVLATAEGNPLFVEQFVAYLIDDTDADRRRAADQTSVDLPIPPTIGALLAARLDRLPGVERRILERGALVGRTFWAGALADLLPDEERADLPRRFARLVRRELIRPDRSDFPDDEAYRFRHLLIRDAAYAALPKSERAGLHERFAGWLKSRSEASPGAFDLIVGYHLEQAYRYRLELGEDRDTLQPLADQVNLLLGPAGQVAQERGDPHAAVSLLRRALDLSPSGLQRVELLLDLRKALRTTGEREASDAVDLEATALLARYPDEGLEHRRRLTEAPFNVDVGATDVEAAYAYFERIGNRVGMIQALLAAFDVYAGRGEITAALGLVDQATALALEVGGPGRASGRFFDFAYALPESPIPVANALERAWRYLEMARDMRESSALVLMVIGQLEAMSGVTDLWRRHFDAAKSIIDEFGLLVPLGSAVYPMFVGEAELWAGEPSRTVDLLRSSCLNVDGFGDPRLATLAPITAQTLLALERFDEIEHYAFWGRTIASPEDLDAQFRWRIAVAGLRSHEGRHDEAVALAREAVALLIGSEMVVSLAVAQMSLASTLRAAGSESAAVAAAHEAQRLASAKQDQAALRKIEAFLAASG